ncbi:hypothetical protein JOM56_000353 [Amanita muscaria]
MAESVDHEGHDTDTTRTPADTHVSAELSEIPLNGGSHQNSGNGSVYDPDAQQMVITSLRGQIQELVNQVTQLNNKLVKSYDRVSDLEDELHVTSSQLRTSSIKASQLELERSQHLSALSTGLLVEKSHVTNELNRLMEKATDEAAQRGQAESARADIEKELDDLSANLFNQANTMVAEARFSRHLSERKTEEAETALKTAEEAVCLMQQQMQSLREEKELAEKKAQEMQLSMGKGQWIEPQQDGTNITRSLRLLSSHTPYQEFMLFVAHLRSIHMSTPQPPSMSTLLTLPFLQRLSTEDSEPTVRIDQAHSLNWLSRRSVLTAIYSGQLVVEPLSLNTVVGETIAGISGSGNDVPCALCGSPIFSKDEILSNLGTHSLAIPRSSGAWSNALFKKSQGNPYSGSAPPTPRRSLSLGTPQVYIFRVEVSQTSSITIPALPIQGTPPLSPYISTTSSNSQSSTIYPLCRGGWCLSRLRLTCQLWSFVRNGIVEKVWEEELPAVLPPPRIPVSTEASKPPVLPPRRKGFWGMASALGEKAATWSEAAKKIAPSAQPDQYPPPLKQQLSQETEPKASKEKPELQTKLPPPPPTHPAIVAVHGSAPPHATSLAVAASTTEAAAGSMLPPPPPVPRRSEGRSRAKSPSPHSPEPGPTPQVPSEIGETASSSAPETSKQTLSSSPAPAVTTSSSTSSYHNSPPPVPLRAAGHKRHSSSLAERIPLPDSRPGTPTPVVNGGPPSRPSSPAPGANSTAGASPPPLPRRAAARGASRLGSNVASEPISRPSTPLVYAANTVSEVAESQEEAGEATQLPEVEKVQNNVDSPPSDAVLATETESSSGHALKENGMEGAVNDREGEAGVAAPGTDTQIQTDASTEVMPVLKAPTVKVAGPDGEEKNDDTQGVQTNGHITSNGGEEDSSDASNRTLYGSSKAASPSPFSPAGTDVNVASDPEQQGTEEKEGEDKEIYVGDATWEERTWKELVRLREDMFWARIGGLR